jgi:hypothetical protein
MPPTPSACSKWGGGDLCGALGQAIREAGQAEQTQEGGRRNAARGGSGRRDIQCDTEAAWAALKMQWG